jgi:hypothetical protein
MRSDGITNHLGLNSFYNSMWLVANDIIIGLAIGSFLMANNAAMADKLHRILHVSKEERREHIKTRN